MTRECLCQYSLIFPRVLSLPSCFPYCPVGLCFTFAVVWKISGGKSEAELIDPIPIPFKQQPGLYFIDFTDPAGNMSQTLTRIPITPLGISDIHQALV